MTRDFSFQNRLFICVHILMVTTTWPFLVATKSSRAEFKRHSTLMTLCRFLWLMLPWKLLWCTPKFQLNVMFFAEIFVHGTSKAVKVVTHLRRSEWMNEWASCSVFAPTFFLHFFREKKGGKLLTVVSSSHPSFGVSIHHKSAFSSHSKSKHWEREREKQEKKLTHLQQQWMGPPPINTAFWVRLSWLLAPVKWSSCRDLEIGSVSVHRSSVPAPRAWLQDLSVVGCILAPLIEWKLKWVPWFAAHFLEPKEWCNASYSRIESSMIHQTSCVGELVMSKKKKDTIKVH